MSCAPNRPIINPVAFEKVLCSLGSCIPPLRELIPHFCVSHFWAEFDGSIYFNPPPGADLEHEVYVLVPLHTLNPISPEEP